MDNIIPIKTEIPLALQEEFDLADKQAAAEANLIMDCLNDTPESNIFEKKYRKNLTDDFFQKLSIYGN